MTTVLKDMQDPCVDEKHVVNAEATEEVCSSCNGTGIEGIDRGEGLMPRCWTCGGSGSVTTTDATGAA